MLNRVPAIYRKEMLDMLRDRRTIFSMMIVPVAAMPLLFLVMGKLISRVETQASVEAETVAVRNTEALPGLLNALAAMKLRMKPAEDLKAAVEKKEVAAGVEALTGPHGPEVRIYVDSSRPGSQMAGGRVETALNRLKEQSIKLRLQEYNVPDRILSPFSVTRENIAPKQKMAGAIWGGILGYLVVLLMFSGGMYAAIDLTAGEKERRTLEVVLSSPAGREELILAKVLATTTAVFGTAVLTVASLLASFRYMNFGKSSAQFQEIFSKLPIDPRTLGLVLLVLLPTAVMGASLMVAISLFAKSFKEAQSYLTPFISAIIFPLIVGTLPGMELTPALAAIPLFNVCQLVKEIMQGHYSGAALAVTLTTNTVYAAAAFYAAVRVFKSEKVLFRT